jgi:hypothetical protein
MSRTSFRSRPDCRLRLVELEGRDTPAGTVTATLSGGTLTLTGTDDQEAFQLSQTAGVITVVPDPATSLVGGPTFPGVTAIKAVMKGGNDQLRIDNTLPFALTGAANFDLGDGTNLLILVTTDQLSLGSLTVKAGDGSDTVSINSGVAGPIAGNVSINLGAGDTAVQVTNVEIKGSGGLKVTTTDGNDAVTLSAVQTTRPVTVAAGNGSLDVTAVVGSLGSLTLSAAGGTPLISSAGINLQLTAATVVGAVKLTSRAGAELTMNGGNAGSISVTAGSGGQGQVDFAGTPTVGGGVTVRGLDTQLAANPGSNVNMTGDMAVLGTRFGQANISGSTLQARSIKVTGSVPPTLSGGPVTINGSSVNVTRDITAKGEQADFVVADSTVKARNITLTGTESAAFRPPAPPFGPTSLSLSGSLTINAPVAAFVFADGSAAVAGNVKVTGTREARFNLSPGNAPTVSITGALTIQGGSGILGLAVEDGTLTVGTDLTAKGQSLNDILLTPSAFSLIGRNVSITLGATDDRVEINGNVHVKGNLTVNAGSGDNIVLIGSGGGSLGPVIEKNLSISTQGGLDLVTLNEAAVGGTTSIKTGAGADILAIRGPSRFSGATTIDLGAGDDALAIASDPATNAGQVSFDGTVNAKLGAGNDTLLLGLANSSGGNANTSVDFSTSPANKIDGGSGLNLYDDEHAQINTGAVNIINVTDPTP